MASVLMCNMHNKVFDAFCRMFKHMNIKVYCPKYGRENYFLYDGNSDAPHVVNPYAIEVTREELDGVDIDFVLCSCWEQLIGAKKLSEELNAPLVLRAGNNNVPYNSNHSKYLISNDIQTHLSGRIKNSLFFYLVPDYETLDNYLISPEQYQTDNVRSRLIPSLIHYYRTYWKESYIIYDDIRQATPEYTFMEFGSNKPEVRKEYYVPTLHRAGDIYNLMHISKALLHIKEMEGYGWSLLEAVAIGLPVIVHRQFTEGKTCETFMKGGLTCAYINKPTHHRDFLDIMDNHSMLININRNGPAYIRQFINMETECAKLKKYLEGVIK